MTTTIFRAKDILQQRIPPLSDSLPSSSSSSSKQISTSTSLSSTLTSGSIPTTPRTTTATTGTIIYAHPIVVYPEKHPNRKEYPYGNYPSYYEKRTEEQTKDLGTTTGALSSSTSTSTSKTNDSLSKSKASASDLSSQTRATTTTTTTTTTATTTQPPNKKQPYRIWKSTLSVLFPQSQSSSPMDHKNGNHNNNGTFHHHHHPEAMMMPLNELAKKVDMRLEFLDPSLFRGKRVLDIGCNSGLLTVFIAVHYKPFKIQGVDIDPSLIGKAQNFVLKTFSQISHQTYKQQKSSSLPLPGLQREKRDGDATTVDDVPYEAYFPRALHKIHGFLPVPPKTHTTEKLFPHNIELRVADWVTETRNQQDAEAEQWDVILACSLTKWIHLHHGDTGLKRFFQKIYRSLAPGGILLLEPQSFGTYCKRSKILPEMSATFKTIEFKPDQFQEYLLSPEVGFKEAVHLGHSEGSAKNFNRDIFMFRK
ncbi:hypothetical protein BGZ65_008695 [Modicella reniformis]|uniref:RNA methyltransferase n=1 Tax=Modicella reniformis TaxID=1440133 RepID=A0A9P6JGB8_9FUNG|nr:hypothetical protein BGZ65_008695 [Modicella reniformis]